MCAPCTRGTNAELPSAFTLLASFKGGSGEVQSSVTGKIILTNVPVSVLNALPSSHAVPLSTDDDGEPEQDPHLGRIRTFEHVEGNYATHVHITGRIFSLHQSCLQCSSSICPYLRLHVMTIACLTSSNPQSRLIREIVGTLCKADHECYELLSVICLRKRSQRPSALRC